MKQRHRHINETETQTQTRDPATDTDTDYATKNRLFRYIDGEGDDKEGDGGRYLRLGVHQNILRIVPDLRGVVPAIGRTEPATGGTVPPANGDLPGSWVPADPAGIADLDPP